MVQAVEKSEKPMATDAIAAGAGGSEPRPERVEHGGFFHIYKSGQGYWTRVGTAAAAALLVLLCLQFLYTHLNVWLYPIFEPPKAALEAMSAEARTDALAHAQSVTKAAVLGVCGGFLLAYAGLVFYLMNKPDYADFLIATDSEMKKVNWTSRKELFGSTKVVIFFMFMIAAMLFCYDILFGYVFYWIGVLKYPPV